MRTETRFISFIIIVISLLLLGCKGKNTANKPGDINPIIVTEKVKHDTDDPAIWINNENPSESIVFGTDKNSDGSIYAFDLNGKIIEEKTIKGLSRPNNVDIRYNYKLNDAITIDIMVFTERERNQIRIFKVPEMTPIDNGGIPVFEDVDNPLYKLPMGIALYNSPHNNKFYVIVGRKDGPAENYLYQYEIVSKNNFSVKLDLVRKFGNYSGKKEIEAIAVDDELGFVYYSDETHCVRKYYADPLKGNEELACFGGSFFTRDIEGIAIVKKSGRKGFMIVSDQQAGTFQVFTRESNEFVKTLHLGTKQTDGCEAVDLYLNENFTEGLFVAMNEEKNFYFYDLAQFDLETK